MRHFALSTIAASIATIVSLAVLLPAGSQAQTAAPAPCGPVAYSNADQKHTGVPCTPATPKAEAGKGTPCGPVAYSNADQKHTGVPCN